VSMNKPPELAPKFYCPYQVVERIGEAAYKLNLPVKSAINVSQLKKLGQNQAVQSYTEELCWPRLQLPVSYFDDNKTYVVI